MSLLVTDGEQRSALAVVRSLGRAGVPVTVGASERTTLAGSSRYCAGVVCYPPPLTDPNGFLTFFREEVARGQYRVVLPITDITVRLLAGLRGELGARMQMPIPGLEQIELAQDKRRILSVARQVGIDCPKTFMLEERENLKDVAQQLRYPVVIKPRLSRHLTPQGWAFGTVQYAASQDELLAKYAQIHTQIPFPLVQEKIDGEGRGVFVLLWCGQLKAAFCHRRLREKPPWGGVSVYSESVPLDEELVQRSVALLKAISWQGVAMVEYKIDSRDHRAKLMEVNGRFWGSLQLAVDAGMNFPLKLYRLATGENVPPQFDYRVGTRSRWLLGDLDHLLICLRHPQSPNGARYSVRSRLRTCLDFLKIWDPHGRNEVFRFGDPSPAWFEFKTYLRECLHRSKARSEGFRAV
jgi:predicted ATP-grasp superfamily ATP-dependent carboligase